MGVHRRRRRLAVAPAKGCQNGEMLAEGAAQAVGGDGMDQAHELDLVEGLAGGFGQEPVIERDHDGLVQPAIEQMERNNREMFDRILNGVAPENFANVSFGLNAALSAALTGLLTGRLTLAESLDHVEWVTRVLLGEAHAHPA